MEPITIATAAAATLGLGLLTLRRVTVREHEVALLVRRGIAVGELAPGPRWVRRGGVQVLRWDARPQFTATDLQEVLTADRVPVKVSVEAVTVATDPRALRAEVECRFDYVYRLLKLALRHAVTAVELDVLLNDRPAVDAAIDAYLRERLGRAGLELSEAQLVDVNVRAELKDAFAAQARAKAESLAKLERARGETAALRKLANAAQMLEANGALARLKTLQTAELAAQSAGNTLVLGLDHERAREAR